MALTTGIPSRKPALWGVPRASDAAYELVYESLARLQRLADLVARHHLLAVTGQREYSDVCVEVLTQLRHSRVQVLELEQAAHQS